MRVRRRCPVGKGRSLDDSGSNLHLVTNRVRVQSRNDSSPALVKPVSYPTYYFELHQVQCFFRP